MSIQKCSCVNEFQDKKYGKQMRVHNEDKKGVPHCTVCGGDNSKKKAASIAKGWNPSFSLPPASALTHSIDGVKYYK